MTANMKNGRKLTTIVVDGVEMRPREAIFAFYDPEGELAGTLPSDISTLDNIARAARAYWLNESDAITNLNDGWRIRLTTFATLLAEKEAEAEAEAAESN